MTVALTKPHHIQRIQQRRREYLAALETGSQRAEWLVNSLMTRLRGMTDIDDLVRLANANGWTHEYVRRYRSGDHSESLVFHRPGEELRLSIDSSVSGVYGSIATGPVSSRRIDQHSFISIPAIAEMLTGPARADYPATEWVLVIGPGYVENRPYETACNFAEYRVQPGIYPVEITDSEGRANPQPGVDGRQPYWAVACAPSVKFHDYYVNSGFGYQSVKESWEEHPAVTHMRIYSFQLDKITVTQLPADLTGTAVYIRRADVRDGTWEWAKTWAEISAAPRP